MSKLREAEVELSRGVTTPAACRKIGVSTQTFHRWRKEYGGLKIDQAKRLKYTGAASNLLAGVAGSNPVGDAILLHILVIHHSDSSYQLDPFADDWLSFYRRRQLVAIP